MEIECNFYEGGIDIELWTCYVIIMLFVRHYNMI